MTEWHDQMHALGRERLAASKRWFPHAYETPIDSLVHLGMGVAGEGGEVVDEIKKLHRDGFKPQQANEFSYEKLHGEMADELIYLSQLGALTRIDWEAAVHRAIIKCEARWG